jgi:hypothetical protein
MGKLDLWQIPFSCGLISGLPEVFVYFFIEVNLILYIFYSVYLCKYILFSILRSLVSIVWPIMVQPSWRSFSVPTNATVKHPNERRKN